MIGEDSRCVIACVAAAWHGRLAFDVALGFGAGATVAGMGGGGVVVSEFESCLVASYGGDGREAGRLVRCEVGGGAVGSGRSSGLS